MKPGIFKYGDVLQAPESSSGEFTPELNQKFYESLAGGIRRRGNEGIGTARSGALARGLTGDPYEGSAVGAVEAGTNQELGELDAGLAYKAAGLNREERLQNQYRTEDFNRARARDIWSQGQAEKMARLQYAFQHQQQQDLFNQQDQAGDWSNMGKGFFNTFGQKLSGKLGDNSGSGISAMFA